MLFNSYSFLIAYLPFVIIGFFCFARLHLTQAARIWLLLCSLSFYGFWDVRYLPLLTCSAVFNFISGSQILKEKAVSRKKAILIIGITTNLCLLFYFKYANFFIGHLIGLPNWTEVILPLGISFFTFTQIAYLVDAYRGTAVKSDWISYGLFVTIFPHLIAGPILHHHNMVKQFKSLRMYVTSWPNIAQGIFLFILGLSKKVLIADYLAFFVKPIFDITEGTITLLPAWLGAISYTLQLYFDFSGYSDMAVGLALLFNLQLPLNFNSPYQADCIIDFWKRWHITLSQFLRDYLYIPLGGNRNGKKAQIQNLFITMVLGGLWHGAGWTFLLWGMCHGLFLIVNHLWRDFQITMPRLLSKALTLFCIVCAWVIFRSQTLAHAASIFAGMFSLNGVMLPEKYLHSLGFLQSYGVLFAKLTHSHFKLIDITMLLFLTIVVLAFPNSNLLLQKFKQKPLYFVVPCIFLFIACFFHLDELTEFLYYQF